MLATLPNNGGVLLDSRVDGKHLRRAAIAANPLAAVPLFDSRAASKGDFLPDAGGNAGEGTCSLQQHLLRLAMFTNR